MTGTTVIVLVITYFVGTFSIVYFADRPRRKAVAELSKACEDYKQSRKKMLESLDELKQTIAENK